MALATLTSEERLRLALAGEATDRIPFSPFLAYVWEYFPDEIRSAGQQSFLTAIGADPLWRGAPGPVQAVRDERITVENRKLDDGELIIHHTPVGDLTLRYQFSADGRTNFLVQHPVKTVADFQALRWIEEHTTYVIDTAPCERWRHDPDNPHDQGLALGMLLQRGKSAWQSLVEHWVGTEELIYALMDFPDEVEATWQVMAANDRRSVELARDSGVYDLWLTWEDSSTQNYSPDQYQRYIGDEIAAWCQILSAANQHYVQHACGHVRDLVVPMRDSGVYAVESLSSEPTGNISVAAVRQAVGRTMGIIGGIEPTHFLNLNDADLDAYVDRICDEAAGGPFILGNSDSCPPGVTPAKFAQVARRVRGE